MISPFDRKNATFNLLSRFLLVGMITRSSLSFVGDCYFFETDFSDTSCVQSRSKDDHLFFVMKKNQWINEVNSKRSKSAVELSLSC